MFQALFQALFHAVKAASGLVMVTALSLALGQTRPAGDSRGLEVYQNLSCGTCHALRAAGTRGAFGPAHDGLAETVSRRLADGSYTGAAADVRSYLRESVLEPDAYLVPEYAGSRYRMPAYTDPSPEELDALVNLLERP